MTGAWAVPGPVVRLFAVTPTIEQTDGRRPDRAVGQCVEYAAWLLEHPGEPSYAMNEQLHVSDATRRSNLSRLRGWLGEDPHGRLYLPQAYLGRLGLDAGVTSDWAQVRRMTRWGLEATPTARLEGALRWVDGPPLGATAAPDQWHWATDLRRSMESRVLAVGLEYGRRALRAHDYARVTWGAARAMAAMSDPNVIDRFIDQIGQRAGAVARMEGPVRRAPRDSMTPAKWDSAPARSARAASPSVCHEQLAQPATSRSAASMSR